MSAGTVAAVLVIASPFVAAAAHVLAVDTSVVVDVAPVILAVGSVGAAVWARSAHRKLGNIDRSVNHRPPGEPSLYDLTDQVAQMLDYQRRQFEQRLDRIDDRIQHVQSSADQHLRWHLDHEGDPPHEHPQA